MAQFPTFIQELQALGATDTERPRALEVSTKMIERYCAEDLPEPILKLICYPQLLRALAADAEQNPVSDTLVGIAP